MKLVTPTSTLTAVYGTKKAIKMLCEAGFDGLDFSMFSLKDDDSPLCQPDWKEYVLEMRKTAESYGIAFEQSHAPFPSGDRHSEDYNIMMLEKLKKSIEIASLIGSKEVVIHPVFYKNKKLENNLEFFRKLEPYAKDYGVKIAIENMWGRTWVRKKNHPSVCSTPEEFNELIDTLDSDCFTACLDVGHANLIGQKVDEMIRKMGSRIGCLHINDNYGYEDVHTMPYDGNMDWDSILKALADIDYNGNFTYEAGGFAKKFPQELLPECEVFMAAVGKNMIKQIEAYKQENKNEI